MAYDYSVARATADRLITEFGTTATLVRNVPGAYDPATGSATSAEQTHTVKVVFLPPSTSKISNFELSMAFGDKVQKDSRFCYMSAEGLAVVPRETDVLRIGSNDHTIEGVTALSPAGVDVVYLVQIKK